MNRPTLTVREGYAQWSPGYDHEANPLIRLEEQVLYDLIPNVPRVALDAACGTGRHAVRLAGGGSMVVGVDASPDMLRQARLKETHRRRFKVQYVLGQIEVALPVRPRSVDLAVCALALCHVHRLGDAVSNLCTSVRPGGQVVITDLHPQAVDAGLVTLFTSGGIQYAIETVQHSTEAYVDALAQGHAKVLGIREIALGEAFDREPGGLPDGVRAQGWRDLPFCLVIDCRVEA